MTRMGFRKGETINSTVPASPDKSLQEKEELRENIHEHNDIVEEADEDNGIVRKFDHVVPDEAHDNYTKTHQQLIVQPAITPKSLLGDDNTGRLLITTPSVNTLQERSVTKSSPWPNDKESKDAKQKPSHLWVSGEESSRPSISFKVSPETVTRTIRDRSQRRSNMFVPLPNKDPLVVELTPAQMKRQNSTTSVIAPQSKKLKITKSELTSKYQQPRTKSPKIEGNVFERLSTSTTESFERKASERRITTSPTRHSQKKTDSSATTSQRPGASINGSPTSRKNIQTGSHTDRIHNTLKHIFDSQIPQLSKNQDTQPLRRRASNLVDRNKNAERKSLIPRIKESVPNRAAIEQIKTSDIKVPVTKSIRIEGTAQPSTALTENSPQNSNSVSPTNLESKTHSKERLTKFQLISNNSNNTHEKHRLKEKLNKRLSEVMRNQQEQQLRKKYDLQQRRSSQMEEESKHRTRILLDNSASGVIPISKQNTATNSVLHDLHTTDHREMIGSEQKSLDENGDITLPRIDSDSEDEKENILASWAEPLKLQHQLLLQQSWNIETILGPIPVLHIDKVFQTNNSRLHKLA